MLDLSFIFKDYKSPIVARDKVEEFTGGAVNMRYLQNMDNQGRGPANRFRIGRKIVYRTEDFREWLENRSSEIVTSDEQD